jgi:dCTP deaminase
MLKRKKQKGLYCLYIITLNIHKPGKEILEDLRSMFFIKKIEKEKKMLSGIKIRDLVEIGRISIVPFDYRFVNPNSYDVHLHKTLAEYKEEVLDSKKENEIYEYDIPIEGCILKPGRLYLGRTIEYTKTPFHIPGIEGKSSLARLGISIHVTAGFGDVGFEGHWTLEITVTKPVKIYPGMRIAQLYYDEINGLYKKYKGKYHQNSSLQSSKSYEDFHEKK